MLSGPHRKLNVSMVGDRLGVGVGVRVKGVAPVGAGPIGFERRQS